jgi:tetratricopeptide (TPR) repeat protein
MICTKKICSFIIAVSLVFGLSSVVTISLDGASAVAAEKEKKKKPKTRRSEVLGKSAFQKIEAAQIALSEGKHQEAFDALQVVIDGSKYKPYEKAVAMQTRAFVFADKGEYSKTMRAFEEAIATGSLPPRVVSDITYNLAQLNLAEGNTQKALGLLNKWFSIVEGEPAADAYGLLAQVHLILEDYKNAEVAIRKAISQVESPKKNWVRILLAVLLQDDRYKEARPVLEDAVQTWPGEKPFWQQLSAVYYTVEEEDLAFVAQQAMYVQGMLKTSKELERMAQLYLYHDIPIKAAKILDDGMKAGTIKKTEKNYELLANAYMHSREWKQAIEPLTVAASKSDKGALYLQLGQSYLQDEKWKNAEKALEKAIKKGGLKDPGQTWLLLGITRTKIDKWESSLKAFRKAGDYDKVAKDAFRWIRSIERRLARKAEEEAQKAENIAG